MLVSIYLIVVVVLVKRQITQTSDQELQKVVVADRNGKTGIENVEDVFQNENEVFM